MFGSQSMSSCGSRSMMTAGKAHHSLQQLLRPAVARQTQRQCRRAVLAVAKPSQEVSELATSSAYGCLDDSTASSQQAAAPPSSAAGPSAYGRMDDTTAPSQQAVLPPAGSARSGRPHEYASQTPAGPGAGQPGATMKGTFHLACPICHDTAFQVESARPSQSLHCPRCGRTFPRVRGVTDLTVTSGLGAGTYKQTLWPGTQIFQSPLVSYVYERGWRQGFSWAGFPGADEEFDMAMRYLEPVKGKMLLDVSCGSGLFSRRFAGSGAFEGVIASDLSANMLKQASQFFVEDMALSNSNYTLLRADISRLPFRTGTVPGIHAGAAIHCWPDPVAAVAEISRVLQPGGIWVATTFLKTFSPLGQLLGDEAVRPLNNVNMLQSSAYRWWEEQELRDLTSSVGLQNFQRFRRNRFIMFCVQKPHGNASPDDR